MLNAEIIYRKLWKKNHGSSLAAIQFASTSEAAAAASELDGKKWVPKWYPPPPPPLFFFLFFFLGVLLLYKVGWHGMMVISQDWWSCCQGEIFWQIFRRPCHRHRRIDLADSHLWESGMSGLRGNRSIYLILSMNTNNFNQEKGSTQLS